MIKLIRKIDSRKKMKLSINVLTYNPKPDAEKLSKRKFESHQFDPALQFKGYVSVSWAPVLESI
jgi:hypothetical protein